jgi:hypothetical protein
MAPGVSPWVSYWNQSECLSMTDFSLSPQINGTKGTPLQPVISKPIVSTSKSFIILKPFDYFIEDTDTKNPSPVSQGFLKPLEPKRQTPQVLSINPKTD